MALTNVEDMLYYMYNSKGGKMNKFINTTFTINDLARVASPTALTKFNELIRGLKIVEKYCNPLITNGRVNHYWFQSLLEALSDDQLSSGGQGNSNPDMFWGSKTIELKGCKTTELNGHIPIRVGASKFFATNGGISQLKKSDKKLSTIKDIIFGNCYHDDYYMITETCGLKSVSQIGEIRIVFASTAKLVENLISNLGPHTQNFYYKWADPNTGKPRKKKINWPFLEVNTSTLLENLK